MSHVIVSVSSLREIEASSGLELRKLLDAELAGAQASVVTDGVSATFCRFSTSKLIKSMLTNYDKLTATNSNGLSLCLEEFT